MDRKQHTADKAKSREGITLEYDGSRFTIASTNSPHWTTALAKARRKHPDALLAQNAALNQDVITQAAADAILLSWDGVTDGGAALPPTYENKLALLRDCPAFRTWVFEQSNTFANFSAEAEAADAEAIKRPPVVG